MQSPAVLSRQILDIFGEDYDDSNQLENISNLLFEGHAHFALGINTSLPSYVNSLKTLEWVCFGGMSPETYKQTHLELQGNEPRCGETWKGQHVAYRCGTCGISDNSCMCVSCFDEKDHVGHSYRIYSSTVGGCCDCGDEQAWREQGFCRKHARNSPTRVLNAELLRNTTLACKLLGFHLWRCLHRMFQRGLTTPQDSASPGSFQVVRCLEWLSKLANGPRECRLGVCNAMTTRLSSTFGTLANCTCGTLYLDHFTVIEVLLNVAGFLPHGLAKDAEMLLLKLMMEPTFKSGFQRDFCRFYPKWMQLLRDCNQNQPQGDDGLSRQSALGRIHPRPNLQTVYVKSLPKDLFQSCSLLLDGLYCQLFHNEVVSLEHAPRVLFSILTLLNTLDVPIKYGFYSRAFSHLHSLLAFPSICLLLLEHTELFTRLIQVLTAAQTCVEQIKNEADLFPYYALLQDFVMRPISQVAMDNRFDHLQLATLALDSNLPQSIYIPLTRFYFQFPFTAGIKLSKLALPCWYAIQEMFGFEHAKHATMGVYLAARYKRTFLEVDLKICLESFPLEFVWDSLEHELRFLGALVLFRKQQDLRQRLIHGLASKQPCSFSELDLLRTDEEEHVLTVLYTIANTTSQSSSSAKLFTLKTECWQEVEFGGFHLAWTLKDEEHAFQAYRKHFKLRGEENFFPISSMYMANVVDPIQFNYKVLHSERLFSVCNLALQSPGDGTGCKTMALLLLKLARGEQLVVDYNNGKRDEWDLNGVANNLIKHCFNEMAIEEEKPMIVAATATTTAQNPAQAKALKALAKKQREFAQKMKQQEEETVPTVSDEPCCVFCKLPGGSNEEELHLLILRRESNSLQTKEMVFWQGQTRPVAVSQMTQSIATDPVLVARNLCLSHDRHGDLDNGKEDDSDLDEPVYWQTRFFHDLLIARARLNNAQVENTVLHTCGHLVHESCLATYRQSLAARAERKERYEGEQIIALGLGEVVCPVCRRVANDVMPLAHQAQLGLAKPDLEQGNGAWLAVRFPPPTPLARSNGVIPPLRPSFHAFANRFDCLSELVVTQLDVESLALPNLFALLLENCAPGPVDWANFYQERFSTNPSATTATATARRENVLHADLIRVFVEWMFVDPDWGTAIHADRIYYVLKWFARLQDALFNALWESSHARREDDEDEFFFQQTDAVGLQLGLDLFAQQEQGQQGGRSINQSWAKTSVQALVEGNLFKAKTEMANLVAACGLHLDFFPSLMPGRSESFEDRLTRLCEKLIGRSLAQSEMIDADSLLAPWLEQSLVGFLNLACNRWETHEASLVTGVEIANHLQVWSLLPPVYSPVHSTLVALPKDFSALTVGFLGRQCVCPKCLTRPENPALCLSCGALLCLRSACCHKIGGNPGGLDEFLLDEVFTHCNEECSRGGQVSSSVFLMLKNGAVLVILSEARFSLLGTLYLDPHQEEDLFLARGKPLLLSADRLGNLERLQQTQRWFQDSKVVENIRVLSFHI
ncbi:hypothetical protein BASA81_002658 [Batrachochytrium salamandrivorans]|nr:hypothetical protein BASA81_002658 [Batrachochytrium salamandrivorans]